MATLHALGSDWAGWSEGLFNNTQHIIQRACNVQSIVKVVCAWYSVCCVFDACLRSNKITALPTVCSDVYRLNFTSELDREQVVSDGALQNPCLT